MLGGLATAGCLRNPPDMEQLGGYVLVYELASPGEVDMPLMVQAIRQRLDAAGARGINVRGLDEARIEISIPGRDPAQLKEDQHLISSAGHLQFRIVAQRGTHDELIGLAEQPEAGAREVHDDRGTLRGQWVKIDPAKVEPAQLPQASLQRQSADGATEVLVIEQQANVDGRHLRDVQAGQDEIDQPCLNGELNAQGAAIMNRLTSQNLPQQGRQQLLAMILDGRLLAAPRIQSVISTRFQITGRFTQQEIDFMVAVLRAGRLPGQLNPQPVSIREVVPTQR
jgi:preprotein translocase subunit SecD